MGAMTLVADRRGSALELAAKGVLQLVYPDGGKVRVGLGSLAQIVVVGEVGLSSGVLRACADASVGLVLLPGRGRGAALALLPGPRGRMRRRLAQYHIQQNPAKRLAVARRLAAAKIEAQRDWLRLHGIDVELDRFRNTALAAQSLNAVMGAEGAAAARYFAAWGGLWEESWGFHGRNRRPPRDPVNALLSLGYSLAGQYVGRLAARFGLDPAVGFLHETESSRDALMLDLLEPVRPWVDQRIWTLAADGLLDPEHFDTHAATGCRLNKAGRSIFFADWFTGEEHWLRKPARRAVALVLEAVWRERGDRSHSGSAGADA